MWTDLISAEVFLNTPVIRKVFGQRELVAEGPDELRAFEKLHQFLQETALRGKAECHTEAADCPPAVASNIPPRELAAIDVGKVDRLSCRAAREVDCLPVRGAQMI